MGGNTEPHGGTLRELYLDPASAEREKQAARDYRSWDLNPRQLCDLELLLNGTFSPLEGYLTRPEYEGVRDRMRLPSGALWPLPIVLDVSAEFAGGLAPGESIALRDPEGVLLATLEVAEVWTPDLQAEADAVFGTRDVAHPGVDVLLHRTHPVYVGGAVRGIEAPPHYDFKSLRDTPSELRACFDELGWGKVVGFHTRRPMHRADFEQALGVAEACDARLLIQPAVGPTRAGDVDHYTRVRCYEHVLGEYDAETATLSLLNLAMRFAGPREALLHAIIRKNCGCTHFVVGLDHAGPGARPDGAPWYGATAAQELVAGHAAELGITVIPAGEMVYDAHHARHLSADAVAPDQEVLSLSEAEFDRRLRAGEEIPAWFSFETVVDELRAASPPRHREGFTLFFTGLSGSGKSTIANAVVAKLRELGGRRVTLLDGDLVRKNLSSELGFSREHRNLNILRIGYVASEITFHGGIAVCAPIAPYAATRREVREGIEAAGGFVEVHVATPLEVCEARDRKGLYAKARAGIIQEFTGISDPYEVPENPELRLDTVGLSVDEAADQVLARLASLGFVR